MSCSVVEKNKWQTREPKGQLLAHINVALLIKTDIVLMAIKLITQEGKYRLYLDQSV